MGHPELGPARTAGVGVLGGAEEGRLVVAPAAALRPSAERNPSIRMKPRMNGAPSRILAIYVHCI